MRLIDLSQPVFAGAPNCPAHPRVESRLIADHETDVWQLELLSLTPHTGSHIDAPLHKIAGGKSIDQFPLERFVGPAFLADCRDAKPAQPIHADLLRERLPASVANSTVILATGWGDRRAIDDLWHYQSPYLSPSGAQWMVDQGVSLVGIDHYSIGGSGSENARCHEILLGHEVLVIEELHLPLELFSLSQPLEFWALPFNLAGHSGSFCRPVVVVRTTK